MYTVNDIYLHHTFTLRHVKCKRKYNYAYKVHSSVEPGSKTKNIYIFLLINIL